MAIRVSIVAASMLTLAHAGVAYAANDVGSAPRTIERQQTAVDSHDDTRVRVQLVVLGIAIGTVFIFGTGAYILRRKLGRVPPPPVADSAGHH